MIECFPKSLKVTRNDDLEKGVTPYWHSVVTMSAARTVSEIFTANNGVTLKVAFTVNRSRSLKKAPFESVVSHSDSHFVATIAASLAVRARYWSKIAIFS